MRIGILALQGDFIEHEQMLTRIGIEAVEVRLPQHLEGLAGLIIPGGESTTIGQVAERWDLLDPIRAFARSGRPLWGTCAGMIVMAKEAVDGLPGQPLLELMDITVRRNAFGRQIDSFEADLDIPALGRPPFHAIFIRAPIIEHVGEKVEVLARLDSEMDSSTGLGARGDSGNGTIVAARQGNLLVTAFHPELTDDDRIHRYFAYISSTSS
jgi:5'-phosphate synthase pdxT subunit